MHKRVRDLRGCTWRLGGISEALPTILRLQHTQIHELPRSVVITTPITRTRIPRPHPLTRSVHITKQRSAQHIHPLRTPPPNTPNATPTGSRSLPHSVSPAAPWLRALFPPPHPDHATAIWRHAIRALVRRLNPARRQRSNPRVIKRKISKWPAKHFRHANWPPPTQTPEIIIQTPN